MLGQYAQERLARGRGFAQAVEPAVITCAPFFLSESRQVGGLLNLLVTVPGSPMYGDDFRAVENSDGLEIGHDGERAPHPIVRQGVVVEVETGIRRLADLYLYTLVNRELVVRQWQELALIFGERITNQACPVLDPGTGRRALDCPL